MFGTPLIVPTAARNHGPGRELETQYEACQAEAGTGHCVGVAVFLPVLGTYGYEMRPIESAHCGCGLAL